MWLSSRSTLPYLKSPNISISNIIVLIPSILSSPETSRAYCYIIILCELNIYAYIISVSICYITVLYIYIQLAGKTYRDIHAMGGGINSTVKAIAQTDKEQLKKNLNINLNRLLKAGYCLVINVLYWYRTYIPCTL